MRDIYARSLGGDDCGSNYFPLGGMEEIVESQVAQCCVCAVVLYLAKARLNLRFLLSAAIVRRNNEIADMPQLFHAVPEKVGQIFFAEILEPGMF